MKAKKICSENDAASVANEQHCMNCYKSENEVFSFCPVSVRFEKNGLMLPRKFIKIGRQGLDLSPILFQRAFRRFIGKDMRRKN